MIACASVVVLTGCQAVHRTALRLNEDGSFDFGICESLSDITSGTATSYLRGSDDDSGNANLLADELPEDLASGDVIHLPAPVADDWDQMTVIIEGNYTIRSGEAIASDVYGLFNRADLEVGEWAWARSGIFIGTIPVEACDLDD
ncbi:hypothetical protein ASE14_00155 [Agromyces sp. Root81]|nr:hypothetical protein ASE14_00155 [Agromyces sp. Root81]